MNITKIHELTSGIKTWQESLTKAKTEKAYAENAIYTAEKEISIREKELRELLKSELAE